MTYCKIMGIPHKFPNALSAQLYTEKSFPFDPLCSIPFTDPLFWEGCVGRW